MDTVSRRYRKLNFRPSKRKRSCASNISKRWEKDKVENSNISVCAENCVSNEVSCNGPWQKRGHTSLYGIGIVVDILTGLVIDYEIFSKYCPECTTAKRDLEGIKPTSQNAVKTMWDHQMRWKLKLQKCYGRDRLKTVKISKEECLNHVAKRLRTGLRNKVKEWRNKGVTIGSRNEGSLKESIILRFTNFYREAVKDNVHDVQKMKTAIFASLFHTSSTDKAPKHNKCPTVLTSRCLCQRTLANNESQNLIRKRTKKLSEQVMEKILPVHQRIANNKLLAKCFGEKNVNKRIPSVIWNICPKETFVSKTRLELAVVSAIGEFNFGC
ncbi:hypothetical protein AVEN_24107-1 [Araneus ventricosus]|uniref:Mutator-like transposase domain-containing protein n=1 Tax=Araneus ventricosus TaxID=182803 RepID=A0A4Y2GJ16_ARAVE|nr:hypothetical protein AVEN_24107-1 [Araneus ventricosus]